MTTRTLAHPAEPGARPVPRLMLQRTLRGIAGGFVLASVPLGIWVHQGFFVLTGIVGVSLFQSAFTNWCPMMWLLERLGVRD